MWSHLATPSHKPSTASGPFSPPGSQGCVRSEAEERLLPFFVLKSGGEGEDVNITLEAAYFLGKERNEEEDMDEESKIRNVL